MLLIWGLYTLTIGAGVGDGHIVLASVSRDGYYISKLFVRTAFYLLRGLLSFRDP
jgi:hypothetical protein